jgi:DNA-binding transcriptional LysR family regulator
MYLKKVALRAVRCFESIDLTLQHADEGEPRQRNWNVIVAENADGKTTLLQAIAACFLDGPTAAKLLKLPTLVRHGCEAALLSAEIVRGPSDVVDGAPRRNPKLDLSVKYAVVAAGKPNGKSHAGPFVPTATLLEQANNEQTFARWGLPELVPDDVEFLKRNAFLREANRGWCACGYGAYRRLTGFTTSSVEETDPLARRFLTLFEEGAALHDAESWLLELDRLAARAKKDSSPATRSLEDAKKALCDLLPEVTEIAIGDRVEFTFRGEKVHLGHLSDGYRSMFALTVDVLRWLEQTRPKALAKTPLRELPAVVLIDEVDTHLHPTWQREVGFKLTRFFPNVQFIVTSHSPFVAMAAEGHGITVLESAMGKDGHPAAVDRPDVPTVRGWVVDRVLTELFGLPSLRDPETAALIREYESLRLARGKADVDPDPAAEARLKELEQKLGAIDEGTSLPRRVALQQDIDLLARGLEKWGKP